MKKDVRMSIQVTKEMVQVMDSHPLSQNASRAGFARIAIGEKLEREVKKMENQTKHEKSGNK